VFHVTVAAESVTFCAATDEISGAALVTFTATGAVGIRLPSSSRTSAVSMYVPSGVFVVFHSALHAPAVISDPRLPPFTVNCNPAMPSPSARAESNTTPDSVAPLVGNVIEMPGNDSAANTVGIARMPLNPATAPSRRAQQSRRARVFLDMTSPVRPSAPLAPTPVVPRAREAHSRKLRASGLHLAEIDINSQARKEIREIRHGGVTQPNRATLTDGRVKHGISRPDASWLPRGED
jgi:hypothetical protein